MEVKKLDPEVTSLAPSITEAQLLDLFSSRGSRNFFFFFPLAAFSRHLLSGIDWGVVPDRGVPTIGRNRRDEMGSTEADRKYESQRFGEQSRWEREEWRPENIDSITCR